MSPIAFEDMPPTMQMAAAMVRDQILQSLAQSEQQRIQNEQLRRKLELKTKRRIRKRQGR